MSLQEVEEIIAVLSKQSKPYEWVVNEFSKIDEFAHLDIDLEILRLMGLSLELHNNNMVFLKNRIRKIKEEVFCIVDIETTGGKTNGKLLELGAVKIKNFQELDRFDTLVKVKDIPENIIELTGISLNMVQNAPSLAKVLHDFRFFLQDSIFVAHNAQFDFNFLSKAMNECGFGILLNRSVCTINFARLCIESQYYGLETLKEYLGIKSIHHRALSDALATTEIFKYCLEKLPSHIKTTQELLEFTQSPQKNVRKKRKSLS
ncbi:3'-5' exonuclease [Campylobacter sp. MIT 21-1685]|uniref:3'-5' exonuclease n=1 Tax=unclassified Campylobacter TaxID=2593542 RepID=UPI00224B5770|nr:MULTISPECIES: 3'-5' exonuclease [unclassified Campylobacter]MCX2682859.1 3'-5' exonuclease [Campylobacter sp. MIT 21-1684]MCX2751193.1 3'-5' exonuclease [Campylobacter sp. MIT 21-1682]MCX2807340.1 3'-5' exonuclease [Campylobacter sp. MIT 21-1685]